MRKVFIALGVLVILLIVGVLAVAAFFDVNRYRPQIEGKLHERLERDVSLGQNVWNYSLGGQQQPGEFRWI